VTLAKALGGGLPCGAIGAIDEVMEIVANGGVYQVGTYNGNPLTMAAARATLYDVMTPDAYDHLNMLNDRLLAGCEQIMENHGLPGYTVGISSKGCVSYSPVKITDYESFKTYSNGALVDLAWAFGMNRGIYVTPGREEEWTLSVQHTVGDADSFLAMFEELTHELMA
jgi:glutamate-1-semialdehyde 2,1-aminomutase